MASDRANPLSVLLSSQPPLLTLGNLPPCIAIWRSELFFRPRLWAHGCAHRHFTRATTSWICDASCSLWRTAQELRSVTPTSSLSKQLRRYQVAYSKSTASTDSIVYWLLDTTHAAVGHVGAAAWGQERLPIPPAGFDSPAVHRPKEKRLTVDVRRQAKRGFLSRESIPQRPSLRNHIAAGRNEGDRMETVQMRLQDGTSRDNQPLPGQLLVPAKEAATMCSKSLRTWRAWDAAGWVPRPIRIARSTLWRVEELRAWIEAGCPRRDEWEGRQ